MKNQENLNPHGKRQSTDANAEMTQIMKLSDKEFKIQKCSTIKGEHCSNEWKGRKSQQ